MGNTTSRDEDSARWRWVAFVAALAPLALFAVLQTQRPQPFSTTNDNWSYFLPLMLRVQDAWLSGGPLRVVWDVGQGWSPWESGQVGWLYPVPFVAAVVVRAIGDRLLFLEVDAFLHLALLGAASWWCAPPSLRGRRRAAFIWLVALAPGPLLIGMNWHDYLMPAPWFVVLLGACWRAVDRATPWTRREAVVVFVASLLFFLAAHPHMFVLGCAFLAFFTFAAAFASTQPAACGVGVDVAVDVAVDVVVRLACAQLPTVPALLFLARAAGQASPVWQSVRDKASVLEGSASAGQGFVAAVVGPWFAPLHAPIYAPLLLVMFFVAFVHRRPGFVVIPVVLFVLLVPRAFPPIDAVFVGPLSSFRFPEKLAVYTGPVLAALWFVMARGIDGLRQRVVVGTAVVAGALSAVVVLYGNDATTTLRSAHPVGVKGLAVHAESCLQQVGVAAGERVAFANDIPYDRAWSKYPLLLPALFNHAPTLYGRQTTHVYEPLESDRLSSAHAHLTAFWRSPGVRVDDERTMAVLRENGTDWLVALQAADLAPLPSTSTCGLFFARVPGARAFPGDGLVADLQGDLWTSSTMSSTTSSTPPSTPNVARPLTWTRTDDGRWRGRHDLPAASWWWATLAACVVAAVTVARPATSWPGLRGVVGLVRPRRGPE
jgi:hypothetical protein